jgi:cytochrome P450
MARRTREFDRSNAFGDLLKSTVPHSMVHMPTNDAWRNQRRLAGDVMSPQFIQNVAAPQEEKAFTLLLKLWREKARLAQSRPFQTAEDIDALLLDIMFIVVFGTMTGALEASAELLSNTSSLMNMPASEDAPVHFPKVQQNEMHHAIETLALSSEIGIKSPLGVYHHNFALKWFPSLVAARKVKERFMTERLNAAWKKFNQEEASEDDIQCAVDLLVSKEVKLAAKQKRAPEYDSRSVRDELLTIIIGGWDTSASATKWGECA